MQGAEMVRQPDSQRRQGKDPVTLPGVQEKLPIAAVLRYPSGQPAKDQQPGSPDLGGEVLPADTLEPGSGGATDQFRP